MPLVIITGYPRVGKTQWAGKIEAYLKSKDMDVIVHNEESLGLDKASYGSLTGDKRIGSAIMSAAKRDLSRTRTVVLDFLNYNSGMRYQLWCEAKAMGTGTAIVYVQPTAPVTNVGGDEWLKTMIMRYEEPKGDKRWEQPLFCVDAESDLDYEELCNALVMKTKPNKSVSNSTIPSAMSSSQVFAKVIDAVNNSMSTVKIDTFTIHIPPNTTPMTIQRLKRTLAQANTASLPALIHSHLNN